MANKRDRDKTTAHSAVNLAPARNAVLPRVDAADYVDSLWPEEARHLVNDLHLHQLELEMQNEELRRTQEELEVSHARYIDLYDQAPIGYVTVCEQGFIVEANLGAASLLGVARHALIDQCLAHFIVAEDQDSYYRHCRKLFISGEPQISELRMLRQDGTPLWVQVKAAPAREREQGIRHCRVTLSDITDLKQAEEMLRQSENSLKHTQFLAHIGSWRLDIRTDVLTWSEETYRIFGISQGTPLNLETFLACIHPDDRERVGAAWNAALHGAPYDIEHRIMVNGSVKWVREYAELAFDATGCAIAGLGAVQDITERKYSEEQLRIAAVAFEGHNGMIVTDARTVILQVNRRFIEMTGWSAEETIGKTPAMLHSGRQDAAFYRTMWEALLHEGYWEGQVWNRRKDGSVFLQWLTISPVHNAAGETSHYVGISSDISEPKEAERKIMELAFYDPLTELPNRHLFRDRLQHALSNSTRYGYCGALLLIDLDNFKILNETHGHDAGDRLLIEAGRRLRHHLRDSDTAARMGGDEFVVLLENLDATEFAAASVAETIAEKIRLALCQVYGEADAAFYLTPSIGICLFNGEAENAETLLKHADLALYRAKDAGRNTIRFYNQDMQKAIDMRVRLETGLRRALEHGELLLFYQPQIGHDGRLLGAEALLRWQPPGEPMISPAAFIPIAEECGLILPIGYWVLETACRQLANWAKIPELQNAVLAVNISARQFRRNDFIAQVQAALQASGADPSRLKLELTESLVLDDPERTIMVMKELKSLGVRFSMDDFGTGYSSLAYLKRLPLDELKIDQSFVNDIPEETNSCAIAQAIVAMGRSLGLRVIAEGVETDAQRNFLANEGCLAYQGYLFGRPAPADAIEALVRSWDSPPDQGQGI